VKARWRVAFYAVDGTLMYADEFRTERKATKAAAKAEAEIPEPLPGRPLYTVKVEPIA